MDASEKFSLIRKDWACRWTVRLVITKDWSHTHDVPDHYPFYCLNPPASGPSYIILAFLFSRFSAPWQLLQGRYFSITWSNALSHPIMNVIQARGPINYIPLLARLGYQESAQTPQEIPELGIKPYRPKISSIIGALMQKSTIISFWINESKNLNRLLNLKRTCL